MIFRKCAEIISDPSLGVKNGLGTRETQFSVPVLVQRYCNITVDVYMCFVN